MIQVQNVTFFSQNEVLISRGMKKVWVAFTDEGALVVKMKGFDRYYYDPDNREVYSKTSSGFKKLQVRKDETKDYWQLFKHGIKEKVYHWEILRDNIKGIELFVTERPKSRNFSVLSQVDH